MNFLLFGADPKPSEQAHRITLSDRIVPFTIKRSPRRRLCLSIDHRGLRVLGPMNLSVRQAESLVLSHEAWIINKLDVWRPERFSRGWAITGAEPLPLFGVPHSVTTSTHNARSPRIEQQDDALILHTKDPLDTVRNHRALVQWLRSHALQYFEMKVTHYAKVMDVQVSALSLSQARARWGSCTSRGHIRLSWRLVHVPTTLIDYVVVHELAHLKEMNHSPRFWAIVESHYPDWRNARKALRGLTATLPLIEV